MDTLDKIRNFLQKYSIIKIVLTVLVIALFITLCINSSPLLILKGITLFTFVILTYNVIRCLFTYERVNNTLFYSFTVVAFLFSIVVFL